MILSCSGRRDTLEEQILDRCAREEWEEAEVTGAWWRRAEAGRREEEEETNVDEDSARACGKVRPFRRYCEPRGRLVASSASTRNARAQPLFIGCKVQPRLCLNTLARRSPTDEEELRELAGSEGQRVYSCVPFFARAKFIKDYD